MCGDSVFGLCFGMYHVASFLFCNHIDEDERAGCFVLVVFWCLVTVNVLWPFLTVLGLVCMCEIGSS